MNYKWIAKMLRHKRWGQFRYRREWGVWVVEEKVFGRWAKGYWISEYFHFTHDTFKSELGAVEYINNYRYRRIRYWIRNKRKNKRKWTYIP